MLVGRAEVAGGVAAMGWAWHAALHVGTTAITSKQHSARAPTTGQGRSPVVGLRWLLIHPHLLPCLHAVPLPPGSSPLPSRKVSSAPDSQSYALAHAHHGHASPWRASDALQAQQQQLQQLLPPQPSQGQLRAGSMSPPSSDCNTPTVRGC